MEVAKLGLSCSWLLYDISKTAILVIGVYNIYGTFKHFMFVKWNLVKVTCVFQLQILSNLDLFLFLFDEMIVVYL